MIREVKSTQLFPPLTVNLWHFQACVCFKFVKGVVKTKQINKQHYQGTKKKCKA